MSTSTDAILAFGYNLGDLRDFELDWYYDEEEFESQAKSYLLEKLVGFTEIWNPLSEGYWDRRAHAQAELGLTISTHCSCDSPMYALVIPESIHTAERGSVVRIDHIDNAVTPYGWHDRVEKGLDALGIKAKEPASWLLYSLWC